MDFEGAFFNVDDYEFQKKEIGRGTFGTVYIAENISENKQYAVKIMNPDNFNGRKQMLFLRESLILNKLHHPAIVRFKGINFQSFSDPDKLEPSIITEYLPHGSLKFQLNKEKKSVSDPNWSPTKKYISLLGISSAMRYLHEHHIIHRDLKPENVLMDSNYYPRVCDFGLSKCFSQSFTKSLQISMTGQLGTPLYMAPEILRGEKKYGPSVDVFAFGILAYEIITGKQPYSELGEIPPFIFMTKVSSGYRPQFPNGIPEKMQELISHCWSEDPSERPSFAQLFEQLSTDFSLSPESLDEDEITEYLQLLRENEEQERKEEQPTPNNEKIQEQIDDYQELKEKCSKYEREINSYKDSQIDFVLALSNLHGNFKERNASQAAFRLNRSSEKGNSFASYLLGLLYENGEGVERNFQTSANFYKKATDQGNSYGMNRIGLCFDNGYGVIQDYSLALEYYKKGEKLGNSTSINNIGCIYANGKGVKSDYNLAVEYFKKAADMNDPDALNNLGIAYENGVGVEKDLSKAAACYKKAIEFGSIHAPKNYNDVLKKMK